MTISDSIISDNSGPGVANYWFLTIVNSTISGNSADEEVAVSAVGHLSPLVASQSSTARSVVTRRSVEVAESRFSMRA